MHNTSVLAVLLCGAETLSRNKAMAMNTDSFHCRALRKSKTFYGQTVSPTRSCMIFRSNCLHPALLHCSTFASAVTPSSFPQKQSGSFFQNSTAGNILGESLHTDKVPVYSRRAKRAGSGFSPKTHL